MVKISLRNVRDAELNLKAQSVRSEIPLFRGTAAVAPVTLHAALDLQIKGAASAAQVSGRAQYLALVAPEAVDLAGLWKTGATADIPRPFSIESKPARWWNFDVACAANPTVEVGGEPNAVQGSVRLSGTGTLPELAGSIALRELPVRVGQNPLTLTDATIRFPSSTASVARVEISVEGAIDEQPSPRGSPDRLGT